MRQERHEDAFAYSARYQAVAPMRNGEKSRRQGSSAYAQGATADKEIIRLRPRGYGGQGGQ